MTTNEKAELVSLLTAVSNVRENQGLLITAKTQILVGDKEMAKIARVIELLAKL